MALITIKLGYRVSRWLKGYDIPCNLPPRLSRLPELDSMESRKLYIAGWDKERHENRVVQTQTKYSPRIGTVVQEPRDWTEENKQDMLALQQHFFGQQQAIKVQQQALYSPYQNQLFGGMFNG